MGTRKRAALLAGLTQLMVLAPPAAAAGSEKLHFTIAAQDLAVALHAFSSRSNREVVASAPLISDRQSYAVDGDFTAASALEQMLRSTGLSARLVDGAFVLTPVDKSDDNEILVTGTRIRGAGPVGSPLTVIDHETIEKSGHPTVAEYLQTLPANFGGGPNEGLTGNSARNNANYNSNFGTSINLRGLGSASTLTLFDGNRPPLAGAGAFFADLSLIPSVAVDRIEILTDGASALYGSDAVAGVVNVKFRDRFKGAETQIFSGTADGDLSQQQIGQIVGTRWGSGGITLAYQYDHRGALHGRDRSFSTEDLTRYGGPDLRSNYAAPGTIVAADGETFAIPAGQNGRVLTAADLTSGTTNLRDERRSIDLLPSQTTHSAFLAADQDLLPGVTIYARALYAHRRFAETIQNPLESPLTVPTSNPFYVDPIGTGEPIDVDYDYSADLGPVHETGVTQGLSIVGGLDAKLGHWHGSLAGSYGHQRERDTTDNYASFPAIAAALADSDPATAFNPFGAGASNNPATLAAVRAFIAIDDRFSNWSASARLDGPLFALPAGSVKLAFGFEHRDERLNAVEHTNVFTPSPIDITVPGSPAHRSIDAAYAELLVPLMDAGARFPGKLDLSAAGRVEHYSDVGRTTNPKVGLQWTPTNGVVLRGSWGRAFRAPSFVENLGPTDAFYEPVVVADPQSPTGQTAVLGLFGSAPKIGPERATTWTVGFDLRPAWVRGLSLSATYFDIDYRDRIGSASDQYADFLAQRNVYASLIEDSPSASEIAAYYASPYFANPDAIAASDITAVIDGRTRNLSVEHYRGVDFDIGYTHSLLGGTGAIGLAGTRFFAIDQRITAQSPSVDIVSTFGSPVRLRLRGRASYSRSGIDAAAFVNYTGGYSNNTVLPAQPVPAWTTVDCSIGYTFSHPGPFAKARLSLSATNLLNKAPPYVEFSSNGSVLAYDPGQASAIGRVVSFSASFGL